MKKLSLIIKPNVIDYHLLVTDLDLKMEDLNIDSGEEDHSDSNHKSS